MPSDPAIRAAALDDPLPTVTSPLPILVIVGPTAGGKTALSIELATRLGGECISADSMQVYRGMDIGTAKPTIEERCGVPHHLLDIVDPSSDGFTVDDWLEQCEAAVEAIRGRGHWPIVVGGTNLYVRALLEGLFKGPEPDPALRAELEAMPLATLREELDRVDPKAASRIHPNDLRRTVRAIEVFRLTGLPLSDHQTQWSSDLRSNVRPDAVIVGLDWPVEAINRRMNARVRAMYDKGLIAEAERLRALGLGRQAREAVGYGEAVACLERRMSFEEAIEATKIRTRRYGKQQRTWLRRFKGIPNALWLDAATEPESTWADRVLAWLKGANDGLVLPPSALPKQSQHSDSQPIAKP
ncbi:MAG: tRNA (adenosine(37)-N6)-dimethylallyltransferase MiaA [Phycisphaerae bacterium]|nr:tRNA (adenosine(37)-N6)-dimethylallyltransferase MiaA [Phycisphaerae bacterium]